MKGFLSLKKKKTESQIAKEILPKIGEQDSIQTIALALQMRGYDPLAFISEIQNLDDERGVQLNPRQRSDLSTGAIFKPNLMDIKLYSKMGLDPLAQVIK